jgi:predicted DNA-binding transcriptional regulator AlpA
MKSKSALERAVAAAFVDELIEVADVGVSPLRTRAVWEACIAWCQDHALPMPSARDLATAIREAGGIAAKTNGQRVWRCIQWRTECDVLDFTPIANRDALRRMASAEPYMPLDVFCELANIGRSTFYDMQRRGSGPRIVKRNGRILIRALHALDWCRANGRYVAICALADWLEAEIEKPSTRARNAIAKGVPAMTTVREHAKTRTYAA